MSYQLRFTPEAAKDLDRLFKFALDQHPDAATRAIETIEKGWEMLEHFPFSCRRVERLTPEFRELVISFGSAGYIALFEIEPDATVTVLAVRHQREEDFH